MSPGRRGRREGRQVLGKEMESEKTQSEFEDIQCLVAALLAPLASYESTAFFSSISTVWFEWDVGSKVNLSNHKMSAARKDALIAMLHQIKVLSLEQLIRSVQFFFADIARSEAAESSGLKQKYLLHFFYKYISSSLQSSEELSSCHSVLILFLRESFSSSFSSSSPSSADVSPISCHILCLLTSILHVYICRVSGLDKKQKRDRKELQDITHKLCEALSITASSSSPSSSSPSPSSSPSSFSSSTSSSLSREQNTQVMVTGNKGNTATPTDLKTTPNHWETTPTHIKTTPAHTTASSSNSHTEEDRGVKVQTKINKINASKIMLSIKTNAGDKKGEEEEEEEGEGERQGGREREREVMAGKVRSEIQATPTQTPIVVVTNASKQTGGSAMDQSPQPGTQALAVLANTLSHFVDSIFGSSERDRVHSLLKTVLHNMWPHLQNHSYEARRLHHHAVKLLSSLSGFQATRKVWRRETFDLFMANNFFVVELESLMEWKVLIDNLMTQDKTTFRDLLTRLVPGLSNIFTTVGQEAVNTARVVKRMSFAVLVAEVDQYASYLPDIQEKLSECLKPPKHPIVSFAVFLSFRTLLLKFSSTHLMSFWPAIVTELLATLHQLEAALTLELRGHTLTDSAHLQLYLSACQLLQTAWTLPTDYLPHFQFLQWGFSDVTGPQSIPPGTRVGPVSQIRALFTLLDQNHAPYPQENQKSEELKERDNVDTHTHLRGHNITSLRDLKPFFVPLAHSPPSVSGNITGINIAGSRQDEWGTRRGRLNRQSLLIRAEREVLWDFLEPFSS